jgi:hypothetical protein
MNAYSHAKQLMLMAQKDISALISLNSYAVQFRYEPMGEEDESIDRTDTIHLVESLYKHVLNFMQQKETYL